MTQQDYKADFICRRLGGRVAIITGGGHGIGKAYAKRLAQEGAAVVIAEIDPQAAESAAKELNDAGFSTVGVPTDVIDEKSLHNMVERTLATFGRIDILINNAAVFATIPISRLPFDQIDPKEWDKVMDVNVKGTWLACRAVVPAMKRQGGGKIINIASGIVFKGVGGRIHYVTSNAAILGFTRTLARDLGDYNITVNCVAPGSTLSEENAPKDIIKYRESATQGRALKRVQTPQDVVGAIAFFSSSDSDFITGQTLIVDGGAHML
jgi:3-oxoacyl-[acyl-carrier protein] reductase